jgi:hypothetical protein
MAERHARRRKKVEVPAERVVGELAFDPELCSSYSFLSSPFERCVCLPTLKNHASILDTVLGIALTSRRCRTQRP